MAFRRSNVAASAWPLSAPGCLRQAEPAEEAASIARGDQLVLVRDLLGRRGIETYRSIWWTGSETLSSGSSLAHVTEQFHFDPDTYLAMVTAEVPAYWTLQATVAKLASGVQAQRVLDLGTGTGITLQGVAAAHPTAGLVGIDESPTMLAHARTLLPRAELLVARLEDPLPPGPFDLVVSALALHHLDGPGKADLFSRVAAELTVTGRLIVGDVVVPQDPSDAVTPVEDGYDRPSTVHDQLRWLRDAGFTAAVAWQERDLVVLVADRGLGVPPE